MSIVAYPNFPSRSQKIKGESKLKKDENNDPWQVLMGWISHDLVFVLCYYFSVKPLKNQLSLLIPCKTV
jgi:hypothetical protein